jgi:hypothetical protein
MPQPPRKPASGRPATGKVPAKPPASTRRGSPTTSHPAPAKNNLPFIIGGAVGAVVLLVVLIVAFSGGGEPKAEKVAKKEAKPEAVKKAPPPDVSGLEATGKQKCDDGQRLIQPRLNPDPSAPKDRVFNDLENGLKLMNEGLEAYKKATALAGKKYPLDEYNRTRDRAIKVFCTELEAEGLKSCEAGLKIVKGSQSQIISNDLSDDAKAALLTDLKKASELIRGGMGHFARSEGVSGHQFDTTQYQEALKVIRPKIAELK